MKSFKRFVNLNQRARKSTICPHLSLTSLKLHIFGTSNNFQNSLKKQRRKSKKEFSFQKKTKTGFLAPKLKSKCFSKISTLAFSKKNTNKTNPFAKLFKNTQNKLLRTWKQNIWEMISNWIKSLANSTKKPTSKTKRTLIKPFSKCTKTLKRNWSDLQNKTKINTNLNLGRLLTWSIWCPIEKKLSFRKDWHKKISKS